MARKQTVWLIGLVRTNRYTYNGSTSIKLYGKKKDAVEDFSKRIAGTVRYDDEASAETIEKYVRLQIKTGLANKAFQFEDEDDVCVLTIDSNVVN